MERPADHSARGTVPPRLTLVNSVVPMESSGTHLRRFLIAKTGGEHGWVNALAEASAVKRQTISAWMGGRAEPEYASLKAIASGLSKMTGQKVNVFEVVAALEGEVVVRVDDQLRSMMEEVASAAAEKAIGERLGPPQSPPRPRRGANAA